MENKSHLTRNDFVKGVVALLGSIMGAVIVLPAIGYVLAPALKKTSSDAWIPLGPLDSYPIGTPTPFNFTRTKVNGWEKTTNSYGVYVLRKDETDTTVFSNVCTHLSCRVIWNEEPRQYICPCHDGRFGINGEIISGPQPRPLDTYETKVEEGNLFIHYVEG
jgi:menaquinol-cytochrome c reductase iron-sulfur subunit